MPKPKSQRIPLMVSKEEVDNLAPKARVTSTFLITSRSCIFPSSSLSHLSASLMHIISYLLTSFSFTSRIHTSQPPLAATVLSRRPHSVDAPSHSFILLLHTAHSLCSCIMLLSCAPHASPSNFSHSSITQLHHSVLHTSPSHLCAHQCSSQLSAGCRHSSTYYAVTCTRAPGSLWVSRRLTRSVVPPLCPSTTAHRP